MPCPASCSATWRALLQEFQARYPQIVLDMIVNDAVIDPVKEGFDCALQIFPPRSEELVSSKLFPVRRVFCASPEYLKRHGTPRMPRDLHGHRIGWYSGYPTRERLDLPRHRATVVSLELKPVLLTNSVHLLREYALEHAGIVCLPTLVAVRRGRCAGELQVVLPEHLLSVVLALGVLSDAPRAARSSSSCSSRRSTASFSGVPPWDAALIERGLLPAAVIE